MDFLIINFKIQTIVYNQQITIKILIKILNNFIRFVLIEIKYQKIY